MPAQVGQFNLLEIVSVAIALLLGLTFHEFSHAWVASKLGDPTARMAGRVTLNPIAHLDPLGTIMMIAMVLGFAPIAWAKPVPINPAYMRGGRRGMALTSVAGPVSNMIFALAVALIWRAIHSLTGLALVPGSGADFLVGNLMGINILLACFNLIPIPPLDGFGILEGIAPPSWDRFMFGLRQYGMWVLLFLILAGTVLGRFNPLSLVMQPLINALGLVVVFVAGPGF